MSLQIYPCVGGDLGSNTQNMYVANSSTTKALVTSADMQKVGLEVGDSFYLTDSTGSSFLLKIGTAYALEEYSTASTTGVVTTTDTVSVANTLVVQSGITGKVIKKTAIESKNIGFGARLNIGNIGTGTTVTKAGNRVSTVSKSNPNTLTSDITVSLVDMVDANYSVAITLAGGTAAEAEIINDGMIPVFYNKTIGGFVIALEQKTVTTQNITGYITVTPYSL
jgi:hypothetical protein